MRLRLALLAAMSSLAFGAVAVPAASASPAEALPHTSIVPPLITKSITGIAKNHKEFKGTYAIQGFIARDGKAYSVGTLRGTLDGRHVTRYNVLMPATLTGDSSSTTKGAARDAASCSILHLTLGPITLNLLGLNVNLGGGPNANLPIVLDITGSTGSGNLLGNLLCNLTNALNSGNLLSQLTGNLNQLTAVLNSLVGLLGAL